MKLKSLMNVMVETRFLVEVYERGLFKYKFTVDYMRRRGSNAEKLKELSGKSPDVRSIHYNKHTGITEISVSI